MRVLLDLLHALRSPTNSLSSSLCLCIKQGIVRRYNSCHVFEFEFDCDYCEYDCTPTLLLSPLSLSLSSMLLFFFRFLV